MKTVRIKQSDVKPLTEDRKRELKALDGDLVDYSDIPKLDDRFWLNAVPNPFYKPKKVHSSIRLDADVITWLKSQGKGYQTKINEILRNEMLKSHSHK